MRSAPTGAVLALFFVLASPHASAVAVALPDAAAHVDVGVQRFDFDFTTMGQQADNGDGSFDFNGAFHHTMWDFTWNLTVDPDPYIDGNLSFVNLTSATQTFAAVFTLPTAPLGPPSLMRGDIFSGLLSDTGPGGGDNSATAASVSGGIFTGLIDGADQLALLGGTVNCTGGGPGCTALVSPLDTGWQSGPGVSSDIGIRLKFTLTPGDTFSIDTRWEVTPVPLPAAVWLFAPAIAGAGLLGRRRRTLH